MRHLGQQLDIGIGRRKLAREVDYELDLGIPVYAFLDEQEPVPF